MLRIKKNQTSFEEYPIRSMITAAEHAVLSTATVNKDNVATSTILVESFRSAILAAFIIGTKMAPNKNKAAIRDIVCILAIFLSGYDIVRLIMDEIQYSTLAVNAIIMSRFLDLLSYNVSLANKAVLTTSVHIAVYMIRLLVLNSTTNINTPPSMKKPRYLPPQQQLSPPLPPMPTGGAIEPPSPMPDGTMNMSEWAGYIAFLITEVFVSPQEAVAIARITREAVEQVTTTTTTLSIGIIVAATIAVTVVVARRWTIEGVPLPPPPAPAPAPSPTRPDVRRRRHSSPPRGPPPSPPPSPPPPPPPGPPRGGAGIGITVPSLPLPARESTIIATRPRTTTFPPIHAGTARSSISGSSSTARSSISGSSSTAISSLSGNSATARSSISGSGSSTARSSISGSSSTMNTLKGATMTIADAVRRGSSWLIRPFMDQDLLTDSSRSRGSTTDNSSIAGGGAGSTTANSSIAGGGGGSTTANSSIAGGGGGSTTDNSSIAGGGAGSTTANSSIASTTTFRQPPVNTGAINRSARDLDQQIRYYGWSQLYEAIMSGQNLPPPPPPPPPGDED